MDQRGKEHRHEQIRKKRGIFLTALLPSRFLIIKSYKSYEKIINTLLMLLML